MAENTNSTGGNELDLIPLSRDEITEHVEKIRSKHMPVFRKNVEGKLVTIPLDKIDQYLGETAKEITFYVEKEWEEKINSPDPNEVIPTLSGEEDEQKTPQKSLMKDIEKFGNSFEQLEEFQNLSIVEREEILDNKLETMYELKSSGGSFDVSAIIKMVEVVANSFYASYANLEDNTSSENVKDNLHGVFTKTEWMINIIIELFQSDSYKFEDFSIIDTIKTDSPTFDSMCKGLLWFIGYSLFYNDYIDKGMITKKIRGGFKDKYLRYYKRKMPDANISIETIIKGGFRRIDTEKELVLYSVGSLFYDIGKVPFITYHDSDDVYDENLIKVHVLTGYNMILKAKKYPFSVLAMTAFHHEYYGGTNSYNFTNPIISKLTKAKRNDETAKYFITYDEKEFINGTALAYFPCKVIEIIDVYNALIGKKKLSHFDAINLIKKEFITQSLKVDPLLFDIFIEFLTTCGLLDQLEREKIDAIIY
ncbi:MAG: hypothetical protein GY754_27365 [bacterium]|nr:hypothetical protein [bacterium]